MVLTDSACKKTKTDKKQKKISDGGGLFLLIMPNGSKYWRLKYRYANKEKMLAVGIYPQVSLKEARERREESKKLLANNIDPSQFKQQQKKEIIKNTENNFENIAHEWHAIQSSQWTSKHAKTVMVRLQADIFPEIGKLPITEITAPIFLEVLRKIENRGALDIAKRVRQTAGQIFRYAIAIGKAERDITTDLKDVLKTSPKKNHYYFKEPDLPEFLKNLSNYDGDFLTQLAIKFTLLTFVRTGEVRFAEWSEFDFDKKIWRIPSNRMKMRIEHIVPLSSQTLDILAQLKNISHNASYVFPSKVSNSKPMSENNMLYALYRMGYHQRATIHGFRATASTILNEYGFKSDIIERQLAHGEKNQVRASYNHAQYLPERTEMMQWWANFIDGKYSLK